MATPSQKAQHITTFRQAITALLDKFTGIQASVLEHKYLELATDLTDKDFVDTNEGITAEDIQAAYETIAILNAALDEYGYTLYKVKM